MSQVSIQINGRSYTIACGEGEERRLVELAKYIDKKLSDISKSSHSIISETPLLIMTALVIADELFELKNGNKKITDQEVEDEKMLASSIEHLSQRLDQLAKKIKEM